MKKFILLSQTSPRGIPMKTSLYYTPKLSTMMGEAYTLQLSADLTGERHIPFDSHYLIILFPLGDFLVQTTPQVRKERRGNDCWAGLYCKDLASVVRYKPKGPNPHEWQYVNVKTSLGQDRRSLIYVLDDVYESELTSHDRNQMEHLERIQDFVPIE